MIDEKRLGVYGGSHGGYLTSWLLGHKDYKDLFAAGVSWNPVLDMSYMVSSTDIPDWMYACVLNRPHDYFLNIEDNSKFLERSPIIVAKDVKSPQLLIIGDNDNRVTSHASVAYFKAIQ